VVEGEEKSCWAAALADPLQNTLMLIGVRTAECDRSTIQRHLLRESRATRARRRPRLTEEVLQPMPEHKQRIVTWVNEQTDNTRMDTLTGAGDGACLGRARRGEGGVGCGDLPVHVRVQ
jgi:hypothetical protein